MRKDQLADVVATTREGDWVLRLVRDVLNPTIQHVVPVLVKQEVTS